MQVNHVPNPNSTEMLLVQLRAEISRQEREMRRFNFQPDLSRGVEIAALRGKEEGDARRGVKHQPSTDREQRSLRLWLSDNALLIAYLAGCLSTALATWAAGAWR